MQTKDEINAFTNYHFTRSTKTLPFKDKKYLQAHRRKCCTNMRVIIKFAPQIPYSNTYFARGKSDMHNKYVSLYLDTMLSITILALSTALSSIKANRAFHGSQSQQTYQRCHCNFYSFYSAKCYTKKIIIIIISLRNQLLQNSHTTTIKEPLHKERFHRAANKASQHHLSVTRLSPMSQIQQLNKCCGCTIKTCRSLFWVT